MTKKLLLGLLGILAAVGAWFFAQYRLADTRVADAAVFIDQGKLRESRYQLRHVLWFQPHHAEANILMADALVNDESLSLPGDTGRDIEIVEEALGYLSNVPDESSRAPFARVKAARLKFLLLHQPTAALESLDEANRLDPSFVEAYHLRMMIYSMLGRPRLGSSDFWKAYELMRAEDRPGLLRLWYMNEFFPNTTLNDLDQRMGFAAAGQMTDEFVTLGRFKGFMNAEPHAALGYVAAARWLLREKDPEGAQQVLNRALTEANDVERTPYWFAVAVDVQEELGQLEQAVELVEKWPEPRDGFDYWRCRALVEHRALGELEKALVSYDKALSFWPGPIEWSVRNMKASCLRELGRSDEALAETERAAEVERLMRDDVQHEIYQALMNMNDPQGLRRMVKFYQDLDMPRERDAWQAVVDQLESQPQGSADESSVSTAGSSTD